MSNIKRTCKGLLRGGLILFLFSISVDVCLASYIIMTQQTAVSHNLSANAGMWIGQGIRAEEGCSIRRIRIRSCSTKYNMNMTFQLLTEKGGDIIDEATANSYYFQSGRWYYFTLDHTIEGMQEGEDYFIRFTFDQNWCSSNKSGDVYPYGSLYLNNTNYSNYDLSFILYYDDTVDCPVITDEETNINEILLSIPNFLKILLLINNCIFIILFLSIILIYLIQ